MSTLEIRREVLKVELLINKIKQIYMFYIFCFKKKV